MSIADILLKPCPYCGGIAKIWYGEEDANTGTVSCNDCPLGVENWDMELFKLIEIWNALPPKKKEVKSHG
jgi:hypothetical protein